MLRCSTVVFCAPPTGNAHYVEDVEAAIAHLTSTDNGLFLFTSSGSVYAENSGETVDETSALTQNPRSQLLIEAERRVLAAGGCVLRLGGLYNAESSARVYCTDGGAFAASPHGLINMVHYEDAAAAVMAAVRQPNAARGQVFLVADGVPLTRQEFVRAARDGSGVVFTGGEGVDGKSYSCEKIRQQLGWNPRYRSFQAFMESL
jgi:nucleoside-diphosphate-sugar epimerase